MCSIGGEIDFLNEIRVEDYHYRMVDTMRRRGPDDSGVYHAQNAVLLHARLAVIDPERGRQPMSFIYNGAVYTIVYNGEIYNTDEVRKELEEKGIVFETSSDTEVVLKAYAVFGERCVNMLNGIFAFAVCDGESVFFARDRFGVKPLYYSCKNNRL